MNGIPGLNAQDVLDAVTVSMGTMGVIYSVVLHVAPQFGLRQVVRPTDWDNLLLQAKVSVQDLQAGKVAANTAVLEFLKDGAANGTGISKASNVYIDLAINPINRQCWIVNREKTPALPDDSNTPAPAFGDFVTALSANWAGPRTTNSTTAGCWAASSTSYPGPRTSPM